MTLSQRGVDSFGRVAHRRAGCALRDGHFHRAGKRNERRENTGTPVAASAAAGDGQAPDLRFAAGRAQACSSAALRIGHHWTFTVGLPNDAAMSGGRRPSAPWACQAGPRRDRSLSDSRRDATNSREPRSGFAPSPHGIGLVPRRTGSAPTARTRCSLSASLQAFHVFRREQRWRGVVVPAKVEEYRDVNGEDLSIMRFRENIVPHRSPHEVRASLHVQSVSQRVLRSQEPRLENRPERLRAVQLRAMAGAVALRRIASGDESVQQDRVTCGRCVTREKLAPLKSHLGLAAGESTQSKGPRALPRGPRNQRWSTSTS